MRLRQPIPDQPGTSARRSVSIGRSATDNYWTEGDDLTGAQHFCQAVRSEMVAIIHAESPSRPNVPLARGRDPVWLCERLTIIQREAKRARARAVYKSAQDVLGLIQRRNAHMPIDWTRVDGQLFVLNKLLGQYEEGLSDLESLNQNRASDTGVPDLIEFDPVYELAKTTLVSLLPHASEAEKVAVMRLAEIDLSPVIEQTANPVVSAPDVTKAPFAPRAGTAPDPQDPHGIPIEWIMSDLVQCLLCVGREYGKILSVSHSLDDVHVADGTLANVNERLFERLSEVIAVSLPLQGVGRLDLDPSPSGLMVSGSGFAAFDIPLPERVFETGEAPTTAPTSRITDDTEADLRAHLATLMDGGVQTL